MRVLTPIFFLYASRPATTRGAPLTNEHESCAAWAAAGECARNPDYMLESCRVRVRACVAPIGARTRREKDSPTRAGLASSPRAGSRASNDSSPPRASTRLPPPSAWSVGRTTRRAAAGGSCDGSPTPAQRVAAWFQRAAGVRLRPSPRAALTDRGREMTAWHRRISPLHNEEEEVTANSLRAAPTGRRRHRALARRRDRVARRRAARAARPPPPPRRSRRSASTCPRTAPPCAATTTA